MTYPGYLLNPGDMFQVDPERVMFATGMPKPSTAVKEDDAEASENAVEASTRESDEVTSDGEKTAGKVEDAEGAEEEEDPRQVLKSLLAQSKSILASPREKLAAKRKQDLRAFQKSIKRTLSKSRSSTILTDSLEAQWLELQNQLNISRKEPSLPSDQNSNAATAETDQASEAEHTAERKEQPATAKSPAQPPSDTIDTTGLSDRDLKDLRAALELLKDNPIDPSKPYLTPWQPREYMSAFAFIPRYLEVNQNICAAVYLRHPVARPGLAEVPTPFAEGTSASAFAWYLRRR
jgi:ribosomal protein S4